MRKVSIGDLVRRGDCIFLVVGIGSDYHDGFALCRELAMYPKDFWIMQSVLKPV